MRETLRTAWPYLWRYRRGLALGIGTILSISLPLLISNGVDAVTREEDLNALSA
jgi:hypothetical protein